MGPNGTTPGASLRVATLLVLLISILATPATGQERTWTAGGALGLGLDLGGTDQDVDAFGLAAQGAVIRRVGDRAGLGLQWDGAWFDGQFSTEKRFLLSAVVVLDLPGSPVSLRGGPGLGYVTVVDATFPGSGGVGDAVISIGDRGSWGGVVGMSGHVPLGERITLDPMTHLMYVRAGHFNVVTLVIGGRLSFGG